MFRQLAIDLRSFVSDKRGVAAIEFAIIIPALLSLYLATMELSQAIETSRKVSRLGSNVADIITQMPSTTSAEVDGVMAIANSILQPYVRSKPEIYVTAIAITQDATTVAWSRKLYNGAPSPHLGINSQTTVPEKLRIPGTFLIRVESAINYNPVLSYGSETSLIPGVSAVAKGIRMSETYYLRPRMSATIPCDKNCL